MIELNNTEDLLKDGIVIVDFMATWCMPCKRISALLESFEKKHSYKIAKADIDQNQMLVEKYNIMSVPTIVILSNGEEKARYIGAALNEAKLLELISVI